MTDLHDLPLKEAAEGLRHGRLSARALSDAALDRQSRYAEPLGAWKLPLPDAARGMADAADAALAAGYDFGPLHGIPVSIKDNFGMAGTQTHAGSPRPLPAKFQTEAAVVATVRRQAAVIVGKTHTPEFAMCGFAVNSHWGTPRNPWDADRHRVPGGSSGGAVVALLEGSAFLSLGTDSGGSVRIPPGMSGVVGLKLGFGRWPIQGIVPPGPSRDSPGPMTRTVADLAWAFPGLDPSTTREGLDRLVADTELAGLRLGISDGFFWDDCDPGIAEGVKAALDEATRAGARLVKIDFPEGPASFATASLGGVETITTIIEDMPEWLDTLDPVVGPSYVGERDISAVEYLCRRTAFDAQAASAHERLQAVDALVCPTVQITAPTLAEVSTHAGHSAKHDASMRNTALANHLHLCALTMPVALDRAGMPVGLQFLAPRGREERLIAIAMAFERTLGTGRDRMGTPPMVE